jgi:hypothetical protein
VGAEDIPNSVPSGPTLLHLARPLLLLPLPLPRHPLVQHLLLLHLVGSAPAASDAHTANAKQLAACAFLPRTPDGGKL